jgi:hypothetical protein
MRPGCVSAAFAARRTAAIARTIENHAGNEMGIAVRMFAVAWSIVAATTVGAQTASPPLVTPTFVVQDSGVNYYRPVVNAIGTTAIFEHTLTTGGRDDALQHRSHVAGRDAPAVREAPFGAGRLVLEPDRRPVDRRTGRLLQLRKHQR